MPNIREQINQIISDVWNVKVSPAEALDQLQKDRTIQDTEM